MLAAALTGVGRGAQRGQCAHGRRLTDYEIRDLEVAVGGDAAYAHGLARMGSAGAFSMWLRVTFGLRKTEGRWQLTHIHASVPFNMDQTFKAAVDLQP